MRNPFPCFRGAWRLCPHGIAAIQLWYRSSRQFCSCRWGTIWFLNLAPPSRAISSAAMGTWVISQDRSKSRFDCMELDYIANRYITVTAGRFLTPFNIFSERLYPNWIRNTQTDPLIFPIGTGSDNGLMLRGGTTVDKSISLNYAVYFSTLSTADHFESERHAGVRVGMFLPRERFEIGMSVQHQLQDERLNRYGFHLQWQPRRVPFELRSEGAYSREEGNGLWIEGAFRLRNASSTVRRRAQMVCRTQAFRTGTGVGTNPNLPATDAKRTEFGANYYMNDGWKALVSYGRTFTPLGDSNIWTVGMTYRFVMPLGPGQ